jgi:hypothetical protein
VSGVVDWKSASIGPASIDVANGRGNLLGAGGDIAERFTRRWEHATGIAYHPWADIITIIGDLDGLRECPTRPSRHRRHPRRRRRPTRRRHQLMSTSGLAPEADWFR